jgi:hypothetical protein
MIGIMLLAVVATEGDGLIADDPGGAIGRRRVQATGIEVRLGVGHEEGAGSMKDIESLEVQIPAVHHVNGAGFGDQQSLPPRRRGSRTLTSCNFPSET